jgi:hypothetical protein
MKSPRSKPRKDPPKLPKPVGLPLIREFTLEADGELRTSHDLGKIIPAAEQATAPGAARPPHVLERDCAERLAALVGSGPRQGVPHSLTATVLAEALARLRDHALNGDKDAMQCLGYVLSQAVADLREIARKTPEVAKEWGRDQSVVPVLAGRNKGHKKAVEEDLAAFEVGEGSRYRINPPPRKKAPDVSTFANKLAGDLCAHLADARAKAKLHGALRRALPDQVSPLPKWAKIASSLPDLSKATWEKWAEAAWDCLLSATEGNPERIPSLWKLCAKARKDGRKGREWKLTEASDTRAEIRQTLREAIKVLAP